MLVQALRNCWGNKENNYCFLVHPIQDTITMHWRVGPWITKTAYSTKYQIDRVGPVDNWPSPYKLHQFVQKNCSCDLWLVTRDTWHVTFDTWQVWAGEPSVKMSAPQLLWLGNEGLLKIYRVMKIFSQTITQLISDRGDCRTTPATQGLVNKMLTQWTKYQNKNKWQFWHIFH